MARKLSEKGSATEQRIKEKKPLNATPSDSGIMHMDNWIDEVGPQYKNAPNEKVLSKMAPSSFLGLTDQILKHLDMERRAVAEHPRLIWWWEECHRHVAVRVQKMELL